VIDVVLDASAILAKLYREPGGERVDPVRQTCAISAVNYAEIVSKLIEDGMPFSEAEDSVERLGCQIVEADKYRSAKTGALHERTKRSGISLGDRYCLQLAQELGVPVLTADRKWATLDLGVEVILIR
jgi:PIN domain nuclease of toxin-antitoxin system